MFTVVEANSKYFSNVRLKFAHISIEPLIGIKECIRIVQLAHQLHGLMEFPRAFLIAIMASMTLFTNQHENNSITLDSVNASQGLIVKRPSVRSENSVSRSQSCPQINLKLYINLFLPLKQFRRKS